MMDDVCSEAERCYREALSLAERLQMHPLIAHCYLGIGLLSQKTACDDKALAAISKAAQMFREMNMQFYLRHAEAEPQSAVFVLMANPFRPNSGGAMRRTSELSCVS